jgi:CRISPR-associated protein Cas2
MLVLVTYDVSVTHSGGARRLRRVARACQDYGQRVQLSVFEIEVDPAQWTALQARLEGLINPAHDTFGAVMSTGCAHGLMTTSDSD